jgi:predicted metal-dependent phosphoesterase TrpH
MLERLRELDMPIDAYLGDLATTDDDALGRPTVARALIAAGHAESVEDAFNRYLSWGKPAYVARSGLDPAGAIRAIRAAGGLPALAHFSEAPKHLAVLRELVDAGLGGLEVYYRSFDVPTVAAVREVAHALGLGATGGSDYHGDFGPYAASHSMLWVPPEVGPPLLDAIAEGARPRPAA